MILEPTQLWRLSTELNVPANEMFEQRLVALHKEHSLSRNVLVLTPTYWSETVYYGVKRLLHRFPEIRFGSITAERNKLNIYTVPSHTPVQALKYEIYNDVDKFIIETIDRLLQGPKKPLFLI